MRKHVTPLVVARALGIVMLTGGTVAAVWSMDLGVPHVWRFNLWLAIWVAGLLTTVSTVLVGRAEILITAYTMGYRHGKQDATTSLLECGVWVSAAAARRAEEELGPDE